MAYVIHTKPKPLIGRAGLIQMGVFLIITVVIGLPYIGAAIRYLYPAHGSEGQAVTYPLSSLSFTKGVAGPVEYEFNKGQGDWAGVFIVENAPNDYTGFEQTCTHLGCPIAWVAAADQFQCPCHGSKFNRQGQVVGGPAPLPLYQHAVSVANGVVTVKGRI